MRFGEPDTKRQRRIVIGIAAFLFLLTIFAFSTELRQFFALEWARVKTLINRPIELSDEYYKSEAIILYNFFLGVGLVSTLWILLVSQRAILPIRPLNPAEVFRSAWHLVLWISQMHGQAIFVRDGAPNSTLQDLQREGPGVIVIDHNSAVVLETQISPLGLARGYSRLIQGLSRLLGLSEKPQSPRVCGTGVTFSHPRERIRGVVDLRKQFRLQPGILCYTRDGIEIKANVHCTFTLGEQPDVLLVTFNNQGRQANLRVLTFSPVPGGDGFMRLTGMAENEVDDVDANEITQVYHIVDRQRNWKPSQGEKVEDNSLSEEEKEFRKHMKPPLYDEERVFSAVFAQARSSDNYQQPILWSELPAQVACDFYREIFTRINYDEIYNFTLDKQNTPFQLNFYKRKLMIRMRSCGVLSYQFVSQINGQPFEVGRVYHKNALQYSDVFSLRNPKVLRDRGIKVINSGFGDPSPVSPVVVEQRLDAWRATWDRNLEERMALGNLRAMRLHSRAHAQAIQDLTYALTTIFAERPYSDEAVALRILQALENAAADPKTHQLLPGITLDALRTINSLLNNKPQPVDSSGRVSTTIY